MASQCLAHNPTPMVNPPHTPQIMIRAGKKALLNDWTDEQLVARIRQCAAEVSVVTQGNPAVKFRVLGQGAQSCVYKVTSCEDADIPPFALKVCEMLGAPWDTCKTLRAGALVPPPSTPTQAVVLMLCRWRACLTTTWST